MHKGIKYILLVIFIMPCMVFALSCSYVDKYNLMQEASKIKVKYEPVVEYIENNECSSDYCLPDAFRYFKIYILNTTDKFKYEVVNKSYKTSKIYTNKDSDNGIITFFDYDSKDVKNYEFKIYANDNTSCNNEKVQSLSLTIPRFNRFYYEDYCIDRYDFYLCKEYVDYDEIDTTEFYEKMEEEFGTNTSINKKKLNIIQVIWNFIKTNIIYIVIIIFITIGSFVIYKIIRKRRAI